MYTKIYCYSNETVNKIYEILLSKIKQKYPFQKYESAYGGDVCFYNCVGTKESIRIIDEFYGNEIKIELFDRERHEYGDKPYTAYIDTNIDVEDFKKCILPYLIYTEDRKYYFKPEMLCEEIFDRLIYSRKGRYL